MIVNTVVNYLEDLISIPSPTGFPDKIIPYLTKFAESKNIAHKIYRKGAVCFSFPNSPDQKNIVFEAHLDALGAIVSEVKENSLKISSIGGYPAIYIIGDYCTIHTFDGKSYPGTILPENPSAHVNHELSGKKYSVSDLYIRPDLKPDESVKYKEIFSNGNYVSFDPKFSRQNNFIKSRHLDDKASCAILLGLADYLAENSKDLPVNIHLFFNVTEETGQGVAGLPDDIHDFIAVDMGCVGENLEGDEYSVSICTKDSSGPYNYGLTQQLRNIANIHKIPYKLDVFPYYGSDGSAALRAGNDCRVGLIGPGVHASHGYERTHISAIKATYDLCLEYLKSHKN